MWAWHNLATVHNTGPASVPALVGVEKAVSTCETVTAANVIAVSANCVGNQYG
jgi:hypothetical protein